MSNNYLYLSMVAGLIIVAILVRYEYRLQEDEARAQGVEAVPPREQQQILQAAVDLLADDDELESVVRRWKEVV
jgi:Holliday junction resolvase-like predicted endonuclease